MNFKKTLVFIISVMFSLYLVGQTGIDYPFMRAHKKDVAEYKQPVKAFGTVRMDSLSLYLDVYKQFEEVNRNLFWYDEQGRLTEEIQKIQDAETGKMINQFKNQYNYSGDALEYYRDYLWNAQSASWFENDSNYYAYDSGLLTDIFYYWKDTTSQTWEYVRKHHYVYDDQDQIDTIYKYLWSGSNLILEKNEIHEYQSGMITLFVEQIWDGDQWINNLKTTYNYDNEKLIEKVEFYWDEGLADWTNIYKYTYTWQSNGNLDEEMFYEWDDAAQSWEYDFNMQGVYDNTVSQEDLIFPYLSFQNEEAMFFEHKIDSAMTLEYEPLTSTWLDYNKVVFHYSDISKIENINQDKFSAKVYPNPANEIINIEISGSADVLLRDAKGMLLKREQFTKKTQIETHALGAGLYFLEIQTDGMLHDIQKVIVR